MQKTFIALAMTTLVAACSQPSGSSSGPGPKKTEPVDNLRFFEGWKCLLMGENGEKKDIFVTRQEKSTGIEVTLNDYDGNLLSSRGMTIGNFNFWTFFYDANFELSSGAYISKLAELPTSIMKGFLMGTIADGFTLYSQELIDHRTGGLYPAPTMEKLAVIEDCREARGEMKWKLP
jgi:hypothetical protein